MISWGQILYGATLSTVIAAAANVTVWDVHVVGSVGGEGE
jgi:hypothetical protein